MKGKFGVGNQNSYSKVQRERRGFLLTEMKAEGKEACLSPCPRAGSQVPGEAQIDRQTATPGSENHWLGH